MLDAKRLAELMQPDKMRGLADMLARVCGSASMWAAARNLSGTLAQGMDALDCAAAVLREVAGREEATEALKQTQGYGLAVLVCSMFDAMDEKQEAVGAAIIQRLRDKVAGLRTMVRSDIAVYGDVAGRQADAPTITDDEGEPEIYTEPMPPPITDDTPKIPLGTNTGTEYAILQWGDKGPCLCSKHRAGWAFLEEMSVVGILGLMRGVHDGRYSLDEWVADDAPTDHRHYHDKLTREIAHAVLYLVDHEETEPRGKVFDHLYAAYQDAKQLVESAPAKPEPDPAEIARLVEIGRRAFRPCGFNEPDPANMAIHDAAHDDETARAAYSKLMTVLAAEKRKG